MHILRHFVQIQFLLLRLCLPCEIQEPLYNFPAAQRFIDDSLKILTARIIRRQVRQHQAAVCQHACERIIDFMRHSCRQFADACQFLRLNEVGLHGFEFGCPLLHFAFQGFGPFSQFLVRAHKLRYHGIEVICQEADLVIRGYFDFLRIIAFGNFFGGIRHGVNRSGYLVCNLHGHDADQATWQAE